MAIYRLLRNSSFGPEEVAAMTAAYEQTLSALKVINRSDPITEIIAAKIIAIAQSGKIDPETLREVTIEELCSCSHSQP